MKRKEIKLKLEGVKAEVLYHLYEGFEANTLLVSFGEKRRVLSTWDGYREVSFVANTYQPPVLSEITMLNYNEFQEKFPTSLKIPRSDLTFLSTGANMENVALCEKSYKELTVSCLATGGVGNALRMGVDGADWMEWDGEYIHLPGTINIILLTNAPLSGGAMARAIIAATEAKTAALQDMDARSSLSPQNQATGTGTDNIIIVSGKRPGKTILCTGGHTKIGELIGVSTKIAVAEAIKKQEG
ncbi:MAG: adenosylcobinamide amidohydrolase [Candidatus Bathyarchaeum sp.]|nr:MAG: adenosylcobinamide amidohydrolase [Candidatus Bathyarchaeum sp.]